MKRKRIIRKFCKTCGMKTYHSKTKDPSIIVCMRCGMKREADLILYRKDIYQSHIKTQIKDGI